MLRHFARLLPAALATTVVAQTFVVDARNGPGTQFLDLTTAVASVPDGAVLLVRAGSYTSPQLQARSLVLLGEPGAELLPDVMGGLSIGSLAPHQSIVVRGFTLAGPILIGSYSITCQQCAGTVVLENLSPPATGNIIRRINADRCDRLWLRNCSFSNTSELRDCHAVLDGCTFALLTPGGTPLRLIRGTTQVVGGSLQGANGYLNQGGAAVTATDADLRVLGNATLAGGGGLPPGFAVAGTGAVRIDPSVTVLGATPPFAAGIQAVIAPQALVVANSPPLGQPVTTELRAPTGQLGALAVGLPGPSHAVPGIADRLFWDAATAVTQAIGVVQAGAPLAATLAVPNHPSLVGAQLVWHGATFEPGSGVQVSPPAWHVVRL